MTESSYYVVFLSVLLLVSITSVSIADAQTSTAPDPPILVQAIIGDQQVALLWDVPFDGGTPIEEYVVEYSDDNGNNWTIVIVPSPEFEVIIDNLVNGIEYQFRVSASNVVDTSNPSNVLSATPATLPDMPINLIAVSGNNIANLSWLAPISDGGSPIVDYQIEISFDNGATWIVSPDDPSIDTVHTITGLNNNQQYLFRVSAINNLGMGFPSNIAAIPEVIFTIIKQSIGGSSTFEIQNTNSTGTQSHFLTTFGFNGGSTSQSDILSPGVSQSLTEIVPSGWIQTGQYCSVNGVIIPGNSTDFTPAVGDNIVCKFTNEKIQFPTLTITKHAIGGSPGTFNIQNTNSTGTFSHFFSSFSGYVPQIRTVLSGEFQSLDELVPTGWRLVGQYCSINGVDIPGNVTSFIPVAGDDVKCTFTNERLPAIIIQKQSIGGTGTFDFTITNSSGIFTRTVDTRLFSSDAVEFVTPGISQSVTEIVPQGWNLTGQYCSVNGGAPIPGNSTDFIPAVGDNIVCKFTNEKQPPTTLTIIKQSIGGIDTFLIQNTNSTGTQSHFTTTHQSLGGNNFPQPTAIIPGASQSLTEILTPFWIQTGEYCSVNGVDIPGNATTFTPALGDDIVCKFTNERSTASLTILKESIGGADIFEIIHENATTFPVPVSYPVTTFFNGGYNSPLFINIIPHAFQTVTEIVPSGWIQTGQYCSVNGVDIPGNATTFTPALNDNVICKFTNSVSQADISVELSPVNLVITPLEDDIVRYTIRAFNSGPHDATGVQITDILPAGVTHVANFTAPGTTYTGIGIWNFDGVFPANQGFELLIDARVDSGTSGSTITNTAKYTDSDVNDPNPSNNSTSIDIFPITSQSDNDNDGILDIIDLSPFPSNDFSDVSLGGTTYGIITSHGNQIITITDEPDPLGIRIVTDPAGGPTPAEISVCGGASQALFANDSIVVGTCGSVTWNVILGELEATLVSVDGETAEISLDTGDEFFFDDETFTLESIAGTSEIILTGDGGTVAEVSIPENNSISFEPETSTIIASPDNPDPIPVVINGEEQTIEPGEIEVIITEPNLTLDEINQMIADLKAEKQQLKNDAQIQRDAIKAQIQSLKDEKQQINSDTQAQKDTINAQIFQLREDRKNTDDLAEKLLISEQIAALHDQKRQLTFDAHNAKFALNQQIMDLHEQKRQINLDTFLAKKAINDEIAELQKLKRDLNDNVSQEKKDVSNQISDLQQEKRNINEPLKLDNDTLNDEITLLQSDRKDINHQLRIDIKDIGDQISVLKSDKRNAATTIEKQMIQDEIDTLKDQRTQLRDLAKQEITSIKSQIQTLKDQKQQNKDDANAQKDTINQQIDVLKELRNNL